MATLFVIGVLVGIADVSNLALERLVLPLQSSGRLETLRQTQVGIVLQPHELDALSRADIDDKTLGKLLAQGVRQHQLYVRPDSDA